MQKFSTKHLQTKFKNTSKTYWPLSSRLQHRDAGIVQKSKSIKVIHHTNILQDKPSGYLINGRKVLWINSTSLHDKGPGEIVDTGSYNNIINVPYSKSKKILS